jgi:hypothetical protein
MKYSDAWVQLVHPGRPVLQSASRHLPGGVSPVSTHAGPIHDDLWK